MLLTLEPTPLWPLPQSSSCLAQQFPPIRPARLSNLLIVPPELIHEIFIHLDYQELISVRQVCRTFYDVTSSRQFCYTRIEQLFSRPGPKTTGISLEDSSTEELKRWLLRRLHVRDQWLSPRPPRFRTRLINCTTSFVQTTVLSGGRWMLGLDFNGNVRVMDLNRNQSRQRLLFRTTKSRDFPLTKVQTWVDEREGGQSFRVAVYNLDSLPNIATRIHIYRVEVVGSESEPSLTVSPVAITPESQRQGPRFSLCFDQDYLLQACLFLDEPTFDIESTRVELRRYTEPQCACEIRLPVVYEHGSIQAVFLPHNRVGVIVPDSIMVYRIDRPDETSLKLTLLHNLPSIQNPAILSSPFKGRAEVHFLTHCENQIKKITFDDDHGIPPTVTTLGKIKLDRSDSEPYIKFGPSTALFLSSHTQLKIVTYSLDDTAAFTRKNYVRSSHTLWHIQGIAAFDEAMGRVVLECNGNALLVLDLI
ncbi:hypothetical protein D9756_006253 [Leucocoprinus leucothites]|uniref:F-box domain-containing protein n=1 Tax=Leucocoprinus leucothites TaxID=201217 RepID=A0A8H5FX71_9AGAR|nr:hypothetical protein D9756_006253 [Leucoagaricus leucothites]